MKKPAIAATLALAACVSVGKTVLVPGLPPVSADSVQVYLPGDSVPPHDRVALLEADYNDSMSDATDVINKFRSEAAKLGATAVVILGSESEDDTGRVLRTLTTGVYLGGRAKAQAIAVLVH